MPVKVIHVVENLNRGAVENWLVRMLGHAHARSRPIDWTFYCLLDTPGILDERVEALGARIVRSPVPLGRPLAFARALRAELLRGGYDVLHAHHDLVSGLYLAAGSGLSIPRRIVHVHNADEHVPTSSAVKRALYRPILRGSCLMLADRIVGISNHSLETMLAGRQRRPGRDVVHYYGVDSSSFEGPDPDRIAFRRQLGLAEDALVLLFGGRLAPEKNPLFTVDVLAALRRVEPRAVAVFAGAGSQEAAVLARAKMLGISDSLRMIGWRADLPKVMAAAGDWFILPRPEAPMEGFGLAVVEAQLAGLRLLLSLGVPDDPLLPTARVRRLGLADGPGAWAEAATELMAGPAPSRVETLDALAASPMDMDRALDGLMALHE